MLRTLTALCKIHGVVYYALYRVRLVIFSPDLQQCSWKDSMHSIRRNEQFSHCFLTFHVFGIVRSKSFRLNGCNMTTTPLSFPCHCFSDTLFTTVDTMRSKWLWFFKKAIWAVMANTEHWRWTEYRKTLIAYGWYIALLFSFSNVPHKIDTQMVANLLYNPHCNTRLHV